MSNALAIATVTAGLAQIIRTAIQAVLPGSDVLTERPSNTPLDVPRVRLFLYQVTPNIALRNHDLLTRSSNGSLLQRPMAAIDLHYLLSFYGNELELEPQRMLGAAVRDIHAKPVLLRHMVEDAIASTPSLSGSNLHEAGEQVKFTPVSLSLEELAKLWSVFFQAPYALSVAYQGTVVQIDGEQSAPAALPVLRRGQEDRGSELLLSPLPAIESIHIDVMEQAAPRLRRHSYPSAQLGTVLTIRGRNLIGETVHVRFEHSRLNLSQSIVVPANARSATEVTVPIADDEAASTQWAAGLYTVTLTIVTGGVQRLTNQLPLALAPKITHLAPPNPVLRDNAGQVTLTVTCRPQVRPSQRASLSLADREAVATVHPADTETLDFTFENAPAVTGAVVRLRVDGVDSQPFRYRELPQPPRWGFDDAQQVTIS